MNHQRPRNTVSDSVKSPPPPPPTSNETRVITSADEGLAVEKNVELDAAPPFGERLGVYRRPTPANHTAIAHKVEHESAAAQIKFGESTMVHMKNTLDRGGSELHQEAMGGRRQKRSAAIKTARFPLKATNPGVSPPPAPLHSERDARVSGRTS